MGLLKITSVKQLDIFGHVFVQVLCLYVAAEKVRIDEQYFTAHETFLNVLNTMKPTRSTFRSFQSVNHVLRTVEINKTCLNAFDDKRYILNDGVGTLAYGHFRIPGVATSL